MAPFFSIDVSVPIVNAIVSSVAIRGFLWNTDVYFMFHPDGRTARFVAGPGLGVAMVFVSSFTGFAVRIPARIGLELLTDNRTFGFSILLRPWVEIGSFNSTSMTTGSGASVGGGALLELELMGYFTRNGP